MEKKTMPKVLALLLAVALVCTSIITVPSTSAQAAPKASKITLTAKKQTLYVGKSKGSFTLKVKKVTPAKASKSVTYKSSKPSVASVNSKGKVTAKSQGTATITVTSKSNKKAKATCKITVKEGVKSIQTASSITLQKKKSATLKLGFTPSNAANAKAKEMKVATSKKSVATVSATKKGVVIKARKAGKTNVTIQPKDGSAKKVTVRVTVKNKITPVKSIKLNSKSLALNVGASETLKATLTPKKPTSKSVYWVSSNTNVATVNSKGKVTAVGNGTAKITANATDNSGKSATCTVSVTTAPTGIVLDQAALALQAGGAQAVLTATVAPETVSPELAAVTWAIDNPAVATVAPNGAQAIVTPVAAGMATITATTANGISAACVVTVTAAAPSETLASVLDENNLTVTLDKAATSYRVEGLTSAPKGIDAAAFAGDYAKFAAELSKDIFKSEDGKNFFQNKWNKFAEKLAESNLFPLSGVKVAVVDEYTIQVTGKANGAEKTVTIVRSQDTADDCALTITSGTKTVVLNNVTVSKADGKVKFDAKLSREGKDDMAVTLAMTATETRLYLNGDESNYVMTFTDDAAAYVAKVNVQNYSHIKASLGLSIELKDIAVYNVK